MKQRYALFTIFVSGLVIVLANMIYTSHVQRQSEQRFNRAVELSQQRWCDLLNSLDHPEVPSTTERGKQIQLQIHELRLGLGCGGSR
jgi:hypothetical protein